MTLEAGTEKPFLNEYWDNHEAGTYVGIIGGLPLFSSDAKYDSGTGWPSFFEPIDPTHVIERLDSTHGMARTEVLDARSGAHLGHVFNDGYASPPLLGMRSGRAPTWAHVCSPPRTSPKH